MKNLMVNWYANPLDDDMLSLVTVSDNDAKILADENTKPESAAYMRDCERVEKMLSKLGVQGFPIVIGCKEA